MASSNLYVFSFGNAAAMDWVLENGPWHIQNKPLILRKWEPNLRRLDLDLKKIPVWVQLYNVPLELFSRRGLSYIASAIGVPLYMDTITASKGKLEFAKVCIEIEVGARFPKVIHVQLRDGTVVSVTVHIPWSPHSCSKCQVFGHLDRACSAIDSGTVKGRKIWVVKNGSEAIVPENNITNEVTGNIIPEDISELNTTDLEQSNDITMHNRKVSVQGESSFVEVSSVVLVEPQARPENGEEFPPLPTSSLKQKGKGKGVKHDKKDQSKVGFAGSKNRFEILNGSETETVMDAQNVPEVRRTRAATLGVVNLLQELKTKKKDSLDRIKGSSQGVVVGAGGASSPLISL
ncbi:hypothetical protein V6N13_073407 [Hibiscus sabdariffa]